jgi:hypothetical protein
MNLVLRRGTKSIGLKNTILAMVFFFVGLPLGFVRRIRGVRSLAKAGRLCYPRQPLLTNIL